MKIVITERQLELLKESLMEAQNIPEWERDKLRNIEQEKIELENYIEKSGEYMVDITNDKTYMVQYLKALSNLVGKDYAMCAPVRSDGTYGAFYVKPYNTFAKKVQTVSKKQGSPTVRKPNLYQKMGWNKL